MSTFCRRLVFVVSVGGGGYFRIQAGMRSIPNFFFMENTVENKSYST